MKNLFTALLTLACLNGYALGPIQNGTYQGETTCWGMKVPKFKQVGSVTFTDDTMTWVTEGQNGEETHFKKFIIDKKGFFIINPEKENGSGYFTSRGLHFEITIDGVDGEDTFFASGNQLILVSSVKIGNETIACEGLYTR